MGKVEFRTMPVDHHGQSHQHDDHCSHIHQHGGSELNILPEKSIKHQHHHIDHNMEGIFLHVLADTLGSVGVVISTLLIKYKGWLVADPACSIFISVLIISSVIPLLRNSAEVLLQRIPRAHEQDLRKALNDVRKIRGVSGIRNLHVWSFTNSDVVGTLHLHVSTEIDKGSAKAQLLVVTSGFCSAYSSVLEFLGIHLEAPKRAQQNEIDSVKHTSQA
ncbi:hypothetical protein ACLB2K_054055 [Fragaria x ananassa]